MNEVLRIKVESYNKTPSTSLESGYLERLSDLLDLFRKYNVNSVFDSGCKDRHWTRHIDFAGNNINYIGGDISLFHVGRASVLFPDITVLHHDCTSDPIPHVDLVLSSDVMIHLSNEDKLRFLKNFISSDIRFLLTTDSGNMGKDNLSPDYRDLCPFAHVNWSAAPWYFPDALDSIADHEQTDRSLKLWHRDQLVNIIEKIKL